MQQGVCDRGDKCCFAHGISDLRQRVRPPNFKTQPCRNMDQNGSCPYGSKCDFIHNIEQHSSSTSSRTLDSPSNNNAAFPVKGTDCRQQQECVLYPLGPPHLLHILNNVDTRALPLSLPSSPDAQAARVPLAPADYMRYSQISEDHAGIVPQASAMSDRNAASLEPSVSHFWESSRCANVPSLYNRFEKNSFGRHASAFSPIPAPQQQQQQQQQQRQHYFATPTAPLTSQSAYRRPNRFVLPEDPRLASLSAIHSQETLTERLANLDLTRFSNFY
ncbi:hypothetical protein J3B02_006029 [Coemansia erecta]|nr:hypothetical protein J3B02_006029 [Coemansia erecta]